MATKFKVMFFFIAVISLACLAYGSILAADSLTMSSQTGWESTFFFVLAFVVIGIGFVTKRRIVQKNSVES